MADTANLILPLMSAAQSQKHVTHNEAVLRLDVLVQLAVKSTTLTAPPGSPADGDRYLIASGPTGAWAGKDLNITYYSSGAWVFLPPRKGWLCWDEVNGILLVWTGSVWSDYAQAGGFVTTTSINNNTLPGKLTILGLGGATADNTNRLSVNTPAVLFNNAGSSISATFNKAAAANDAGFTFQTGFSSRALFGLLGSDELQFKVTPDGSNFYTNIRGYKDLHGRTAFKDAYRKTFAEWQGRPNSTTVDQFGITATVTGTATAVAPTSSALFTAAPRVDLATAATAGASAGLNGPLAVWRGNASGQGGFYLRMRGGIETFQATSRGFMGLYASASAIGNVNPSTLLNIVGIGFDSGDTQLQLMTNDGTGAATKTALGADFPTTGGWDLYELILSAEPNGSAINYRVERLNGGNVASGTITTDLPANTSFLAPHVWFNNGTTAGSAVFGFVDMYLEFSNLLGSQGVM